MAGLEVLFASAAPAMTCPQDALVCFLHWEVVTNGYYVLGTGDQTPMIRSQNYCRLSGTAIKNCMPSGMSLRTVPENSF